MKTNIKKLDSKDKTFFYSNLTEMRQITFQIPRCSSSSPPPHIVGHHVDFP